MKAVRNKVPLHIWKNPAKEKGAHKIYIYKIPCWIIFPPSSNIYVWVRLQSLTGSVQPNKSEII